MESRSRRSHGVTCRPAALAALLLFASNRVCAQSTPPESALGLSPPRAVSPYPIDPSWPAPGSPAERVLQLGPYGTLVEPADTLAALRRLHRRERRGILIGGLGMVVGGAGALVLNGGTRTCFPCADATTAERGVGIALLAVGAGAYAYGEVSGAAAGVRMSRHFRSLGMRRLLGGPIATLALLASVGGAPYASVPLWVHVARARRQMDAAELYLRPVTLAVVPRIDVRTGRYDAAFVGTF